jgi:hypothetical protein
MERGLSPNGWVQQKVHRKTPLNTKKPPEKRAVLRSSLGLPMHCQQRFEYALKTSGLNLQSQRARTVD